MYRTTGARNLAYLILWLSGALALIGCDAAQPTSNSPPSTAAGIRIPSGNSSAAALQLASELPEVGSVPIGTPSPAAEPLASATFPTSCGPGASAPRALASKKGYVQYEITVTSSDNAAIEDLKQSDFVAASGGKQIPVVFFNGLMDSPVSLAILVDTSGSMAPKLSWVRLALDEFIRSLNPKDQIILFAFSAHPFLLQAPTTDHALVRSRLLLLHAYGQTAAFDSEIEGARMLEQTAYPNRAMLVITDGMDNASSENVDQVGQQIRTSKVAFFGIGIGNPAMLSTETSIGVFKLPIISDADRVDAAPLEKLASDSGGKARIVRTDTDSTATDFANALASVAQSLHGSYSVGVLLPSPKRDNTVQIGVTRHPGATVIACLSIPASPPSKEIK
jgi:Ca-activated chloride channel family protein